MYAFQYEYIYILYTYEYVSPPQLVVLVVVTYLANEICRQLLIGEMSQCACDVEEKRQHFLLVESLVNNLLQHVLRCYEIVNFVAPPPRQWEAA